MTDDELEAWIVEQGERLRPEPIDNPKAELDRIQRAIGVLRSMADKGNFEAVEAIVKTGLDIADLLYFARVHLSEAWPLKHVVGVVAEHAERWPIAVPAIVEIQAATISDAVPANLGEARVIQPRPKGRKGRFLTSWGQTRLAFDAHCALESRRTGQPSFNFGESWEPVARELEGLDRHSLDAWASAGAMLVRAEIKRAHPPHLVVIPEDFLAAVVRTQKGKLSFESALLTISKQWLKAGFEQLLGAP